jgi:ATP-dependent Clp protease ATP-binding subunit ClpC
MFERHTETARRVIFLARYMAGRVGSPVIDTEHILLGLLREDQGLALRFLGSPWAAEEVWKVIERIKPVKARDPFPKEIPLTAESKCALTFALEEADLASNEHVCTEHLLLGLLHEESGFAAKILSERGLDLAFIRGDLLRTPHDDSANGRFLRERAPLPPDVVELQNRVASIMKNVDDAITANDFTKVKTLSHEERTESDKLFLLYRKLGLNDWLYNQG